MTRAAGAVRRVMRSLVLAIALVLSASAALAQDGAQGDPPPDWPPEGARSPAALCAWWRTHGVGDEPVPRTCSIVCRASDRATPAVVLRRATGFHEGLAVAVRERGRWRVVHDDVDDAEGVIIQGGMVGGLRVTRCAVLRGGAVEVDVARWQTGEPPDTCTETRDASRLRCAMQNERWRCERTVTQPPQTTPRAACEPD